MDSAIEQGIGSKIYKRLVPKPVRQALNDGTFASKIRQYFSTENAAYKWWVATTLIVGMLSVALTMNMTQIATPQIMVSLKMDIYQAVWFQTASNIGRTVLVPATGWLGGILGNKNLYIFSLISYIVTSALSGLAWDAESLIFFQVVQGLGSSVRQPLAMAMLFAVFPPYQRGLAVGLWTMGFSFFPAFAPILGGWLVENWGWRSIFYVSIPVGVIGLIMTMIVISEIEEREAPSLDLFGLLTMVTSLVTLLLGLSEGRRGGNDSVYVITMYTIAAVTFIMFIFAEVRAKKPIVELALFKNIGFSLACTARMLNGMGMMGVQFIITLFVQRVLHYSPLQAGIFQVPAAASSGVSGLLSGKLADKFDSRFLILFGLLTTALITYKFTYLNVWAATTVVVVVLTARSFTRGFVMAPLTTAALRSVPENKVRMATGLMGLIMSLGGTIGTTVLGTILGKREAYYTALYYQDQNFLSNQGAVSVMRRVFEKGGDPVNIAQVKSLNFLRTQVREEATLAAYHDCFKIAALLSVINSLPVLFIPKGKEGGVKRGGRKAGE